MTPLHLSFIDEAKKTSKELHFIFVKQLEHIKRRPNRDAIFISLIAKLFSKYRSIIVLCEADANDDDTIDLGRTFFDTTVTLYWLFSKNTKISSRMKLYREHSTEEEYLLLSKHRVISEPLKKSFENLKRKYKRLCVKYPKSVRHNKRVPYPSLWKRTQEYHLIDHKWQNFVSWWTSFYVFASSFSHPNMIAIPNNFVPDDTLQKVAVKTKSINHFFESILRTGASFLIAAMKLFAKFYKLDCEEQFSAILERWERLRKQQSPSSPST